LSPDTAADGPILAYLADRYVPVQTDWTETAAIARALGEDVARIDARCGALAREGLLELSAPDAENDCAAAIITVKGLLAIGRLP
jgi:hypothetical protein